MDNIRSRPHGRYYHDRGFHNNESASIPSNENMTSMIKITLALIGGFSASLVYPILNRIVETIKFFIEPALSSKQAALKASLKNNFEVNNYKPAQN